MQVLTPKTIKLLLEGFFCIVSHVSKTALSSLSLVNTTVQNPSYVHNIMILLWLYDKFANIRNVWRTYRRMVVQPASHFAKLNLEIITVALCEAR